MSKAIMFLSALIACAVVGCSDEGGGEPEPGPPGEQGPAGPAGAPGEAGDQGPAGSAGDPGEDGDPGPVGADGLALTWLGTFADPPESPGTNDAYYDSTDGVSYVYDGTEWQIIAQDGMDGLDGVDGVDGADGAPGPEGDPGPQGEQGLQGLQGPAGMDGVDGVDGVDGAPGPQGDPGPQGPPGADGSDGAPGPQGNPGPQGDPGPQGVAGPAGPAGGAWGEAAAVFAGFTSTSFDGDQGGRAGMHAACDAEFAGGHLCHVSEYVLSNSATPTPLDGAWIDYSCGLSSVSTVSTTLLGNVLAGRSVASGQFGNCGNWTSNLGTYTGLTVVEDGMESSMKYCDTPRRLACCSSPFQEVFAGFTATSHLGGMGGRAGAHFMCGQEFPGSHMCHAAEYVRTNSAVDPPVDGAWVDYSAGFKQGSAGTFSTVLCASVDLGRSIASGQFGNCGNWTSDLGTYTGMTIIPEEFESSMKYCDTPRPIACCE